MGKRRILTDFVIDKIAAVDNPCQEGARVAIIKRKEDDMDTISKKEHDDQIAKLNGDWQKKLDDLTKQVEKLQADNAEAVAKAKMSDEEKEYMEGMKDEEKKKFLALTEAERKKAAKIAKGADETITVDGAVIRKSVVGDAAFAVMKSQQARIEENAKAIEKANDEAETAKIEKRVASEFKHIPGKPADIAKVFKAAARLPKEVSDIFETIMKAADAMAAKGFEKLGHNLVEIKKGQEPFNEKVAEIQKSRKISKADAMVKAAEEYPDLYEAYQEAGTQTARAAA